MLEVRPNEGLGLLIPTRCRHWRLVADVLICLRITEWLYMLLLPLWRNKR